MQPRGVRNNNFGNIEDGPFARSQPGYSGSDGRFALFDTPDSGWGAMNALLRSYGRRGFNTPSSIVGRWAPESDGNNVGSYSGFVANKLGIGPNDPIDFSDPNSLSALSLAMAQYENGPSALSGSPGVRAISSALRPAAGSQPQTLIPASPDQPRQGASIGNMLKQAGAAMMSVYDPKGAAVLASMVGEDEPRKRNLQVTIDQQSGKAFVFDPQSGELKSTVFGDPQDTFNKQYTAASAKKWVDKNQEIMNNAEKARMMQGRIGELNTLLRDPSVYQGPGGEQVLKLKALANSIGLGSFEGVENAQLALSIARQMALELRNPAFGAGMPGSLSDADRQFLASMPPSLTNTPEGNAKIAEYFNRVAQRAIDIERLRQEHVSRYGVLDDRFARSVSEYGTRNPLFSAQDSWQVQGAASPPAQSAVKSVVPVAPATQVAPAPSLPDGVRAIKQIKR